MNKFVLLILLLSGVAMAGEVSETHCVATLDLQTGFVNLTNEINAGDNLVEGSCLELAKYMSKSEIAGHPVQGVKLTYKNPEVSKK